MSQYYEQQQTVVKQCIEQLYEKEGTIRDNDGILNIHGSFDGTWMMRGHQLHIGAGFVKDLLSGFDVDLKY